MYFFEKVVVFEILRVLMTVYFREVGETER